MKCQALHRRSLWDPHLDTHRMTKHPKQINMGVFRLRSLHERHTWHLADVVIAIQNRKNLLTKKLKKCGCSLKFLKNVTPKTDPTKSWNYPSKLKLLGVSWGDPGVRRNRIFRHCRNTSDQCLHHLYTIKLEQWDLVKVYTKDHLNIHCCPHVSRCDGVQWKPVNLWNPDKIRVLWDSHFSNGLSFPQPIQFGHDWPSALSSAPLLPPRRSPPFNEKSPKPLSWKRARFLTSTRDAFLSRVIWNNISEAQEKSTSTGTTP